MQSSPLIFSDAYTRSASKTQKDKKKFFNFIRPSQIDSQFQINKRQIIKRKFYNWTSFSSRDIIMDLI